VAEDDAGGARSEPGGERVLPAITAASQRTLTPVVRIAAPSTRGVLRMLFLIVVTAIVLYLLWRVRNIVRLAGISLFLGLALLPIVDAIDHRMKKVPRPMTILAVFLTLFALVVVIGAVVIPGLVKEVGQLSNDAPRYAGELRGNSTFRHYDNRYHITPKLVKDARTLPTTLGHLVGPLKDVTVSAFAAIGQLFTVLALTFLLLLHGRRYLQEGLTLTGARAEHYRRLVVEVEGAVARYVLGNVIISLLATIATWVVLTILGVPYALALGIVVGFFDLLPLVGATLGAIVVALATVTVSFPIATIVWVAFIIVWQRIEDYIVQPMVYGRALHVNPIVTILSVLIGASLLGVLGALIAIPTAAAIQIIITDWWSRRRAPAASGAAAGTATEQGGPAGFEPA
jgi:predicted PurR-regulated permease PerM